MPEKDQPVTESSLAGLEQRVARCELIMGTMLIANTGKLAPFDIREAMESFFAARTSDADLLAFLQEMLRSQRVSSHEPPEAPIHEELFHSINEIDRRTHECSAQIQHIREVLADYRDEVISGARSLFGFSTSFASATRFGLFTFNSVGPRARLSSSLGDCELKRDSSPLSV